MSRNSQNSPVSLKVDVARLPAKGVTVKLDADAAQREMLATQHGLELVSAFRFELRVAPWKRDGVKITGEVAAEITQACVVTLDPVDSAINEAVSAVFVPENSRIAAIPDDSGELLLDFEGDDAPEMFSGNRIDAGAVAEEFFSLAIDPYPRRPDAELPAAGHDDGTVEEAPKPFQKLGSLVRKP